MPGFDKLPNRVKAALSKESPRVAWVAGLATGLPAAYYLAAIAAILKSGSSAGVQVAALIVFNVVAFMQAVVPLVAFLFAPEATGELPSTGRGDGTRRNRRHLPSDRRGQKTLMQASDPTLL
jgi:hypothetical protein